MRGGIIVRKMTRLSDSDACARGGWVADSTTPVKPTPMAASVLTLMRFMTTALFGPRRYRERASTIAREINF
jgi:hypothetical protein